MQASAARTNINVSCDQVFVITQVNARRDISEMHISSNLAHGMEISNSQNSKSYISKVNMDYNYPTELCLLPVSPEMFAWKKSTFTQELLVFKIGMCN